MKSVLVIFYSQTGLLRQAVEAALGPLHGAADITYARIVPKVPYPHPWRYTEFLGVFPDAVSGNTCQIDIDGLNEDKAFDLVVIAYQPWFLSISIPMRSFLTSAVAARVLCGRNVVTLLACRNMWLTSQMQMKDQLRRIGARLIGHIAFVDRAPNLISLVTVLAYLLKGTKGRLLGVFPPYGISKSDLCELAPRCGRILLAHLRDPASLCVQEELVRAGAVSVLPQLMLLERRGRRIFERWANFICASPQNSRSWKFRLRVFGVLLPLGVVIFAPALMVLTGMLKIFKAKQLKREAQLHASLSNVSD